MAWILRLVETGAEGEGQARDVIEIDRPGGLRDIGTLGLTLSGYCHVNFCRATLSHGRIFRVDYASL